MTVRFSTVGCAIGSAAYAFAIRFEELPSCEKRPVSTDRFAVMFSLGESGTDCAARSSLFSWSASNVADDLSEVINCYELVLRDRACANIVVY